jgi:hypothetical protein
MIMLFAKHYFEILGYDTAGEATTRPLRGDAELGRVEYGLGITAVAG